MTPLYDPPNCFSLVFFFFFAPKRKCFIDLKPNILEELVILLIIYLLTFKILFFLSLEKSMNKQLFLR